MHSRILTTHVGSLPRNRKLSRLLIEQERGDRIDEEELSAEKRKAVEAVVNRQLEARIDIINDGEQPRVGFQTYVPLRMRGFGGQSNRPAPRDLKEFPDFAAMVGHRFPERSKTTNAPAAIGPIIYEDLSEAEKDIDLFESVTSSRSSSFVERFMTSPSPGIIATTMLNKHYDNHERYVFALAREMRKEYQLIAERGLILQIDAPDLAMERTILFQDKTLNEFLEVAEIHVAALNLALEGIARSRVRLHCCWGNWEGPHIHDIELKEILPLIAQANVEGLSLEFANPRHQHELASLKVAGFPKDKLLLPGVIDSTSNYVEHPELVANRICSAVDAVGDREKVIASVDCGFGTFTGYEFVAESIVWAKLRSLAEGATIASRRLWGQAPHD
jgi:5-methyltetrahydropteroyltriglutamate--homocysteine methyltransferase